MKSRMASKFPLDALSQETPFKRNQSPLNLKMSPSFPSLAKDESIQKFHDLNKKDEWFEKQDKFSNVKIDGKLVPELLEG